MTLDVLATLAENTRDHIVAQVRRQRPWDAWLLVIVLSLVGLGFVMLYSSSAVMASQKLGSPTYLVTNQLQKFALGVMLLFLGLKLDYRWYKRLIYPIFLVAVISLILVAIPGIGVVQNGARRWFSLGGMSFQPAEIAKIAAVMYLAYSVEKKGARMAGFMSGVVPHALMIGGLVGLLMLQPDFGSSMILIVLMSLMVFVSGTRWRNILAVLASVATFAGLAILAQPYRVKRVLAFLDPWASRQTTGYQISESLIAIGSGGLSGKGLGNGTGKLGYVPELWNDFIGTIIAEELGLFGVLLVVGLFAALIWRGLRIALSCDDQFGAYLAFGLTALFGIQASANLCVVTGLLPNKGLTLPFVSFGGSSLIIALFAIGILLNISRNAPDGWALELEQRKRMRDIGRRARRAAGD